MLIHDSTLKEAILRALADPVDHQLISITSSAPHAVSCLAEYTETSISSLYRRLKRLEQEGLLYIQRSLDPETDKPINRYRSYFSHISIDFDGQQTKIEVVPTKPIIERTHRLFSSFRK